MFVGHPFVFFGEIGFSFFDWVACCFDIELHEYLLMPSGSLKKITCFSKEELNKSPQTQTPRINLTFILGFFLCIYSEKRLNGWVCGQWIER